MDLRRTEKHGKSFKLKATQHRLSNCADGDRFIDPWENIQLLLICCFAYRVNNKYCGINNIVTLKR